MLDYTRFRNFDPFRIHHFIEKRHEALGPIYKENIFPGVTRPTVYTSAPEDVETVFRAESKNSCRPTLDFVAKSRDVLGIHPGLVNSQGETWKRIRKFYNQHLLGNEILFDSLHKHLEISFELMDYIDKNKNNDNEVKEFDFFLYWWSLKSTTAFALNKNQQTFKQDLPQNTKALIEATAKLFTNWTSIMFSTPLKNFFNRKDIAKLKKCQVEQFSAFQQYYKSLQNEMVQSKLEQLIEESDLDPAEKEVIVYDVFTDSIDTVAHVAAFVCYCLAVNPEKQEVLRNEINNVFVSSSDITGKTLLQMPYLHAFNLEVQRLYPLTMGIARKTSVDMVLSGYHVPANTSIELTANIVNNRDPK